MKTAKKTLAWSSLAFIFFFLIFSIFPLNTNAAGCDFSCKSGSEDANAYCTRLFGSGSRIGTTFSLNGTPDCDMKNAPKCGLTDIATCCCAPDDSLITPYQPSKITGSETNKPKYEIPELQIKIPGLDNLGDVTCDNEEDGSFVCSVPWIGNYISGIYKYALGIAGVLAAVMLMAGGLIWLVSGGDASNISKAKTLITGSITGLIILFAAYTLLYQINPDLTIFKPITIKNIASDPEPFSLEGNPTNSNECLDCVKITSIPVKDKKSSSVNKDFLVLLEKAYQATPKDISWRITEAWPPTQKHKDKCHYNGVCVDIGLTVEKSCANVTKLESILKTIGFTVILNEYKDCGGVQTTYSSGGHFHLR